MNPPELFNCETIKYDQDVIQVHIFENKHEAQEMATRYRNEYKYTGGLPISVRTYPRDIKVAKCKVRVYCVVRKVLTIHTRG